MVILLYIAIGLTVGVLSGALGIGGGVLLVPALIWLCGLDVKTATGTTLAILVPPLGLPAALKYFAARQLNLEAALWIAGGFALGGYVGASLVVNGYLPDRPLRLCFGLMMLYIAVRWVIHSDSEAVNAAAGLSATLLAWIGFLALRALGRRHLPQPDLGEHIRRMKEEGRGESDYHI